MDVILEAKNKRYFGRHKGCYLGRGKSMGMCLTFSPFAAMKFYKNE